MSSTGRLAAATASDIVRRPWAGTVTGPANCSSTTRFSPPEQSALVVVVSTAMLTLAIDRAKSYGLVNVRFNGCFAPGVSGPAASPVMVKLSFLTMVQVYDAAGLTL